jgi:ribonuclease R
LTNKIKDILVRQDNFNTALHGDTVRVKIIKENFKTGKCEGSITEVVSKKTNRVYW